MSFAGLGSSFAGLGIESVRFFAELGIEAENRQISAGMESRQQPAGFAFGFAFGFAAGAAFAEWVNLHFSPYLQVPVSAKNLQGSLSLPSPFVPLPLPLPPPPPVNGAAGLAWEYLQSFPCLQLPSAKFGKPISCDLHP